MQLGNGKQRERKIASKNNFKIAYKLEVLRPEKKA